MASFRTPILRSWGRHDRISTIGTVIVGPSRKRVGLYFKLLPDDANVRGEDTVAFLRELRRQLPAPMAVLWDRGKVHDRSKAVCAYLAEHPLIEPRRVSVILRKQTRTNACGEILMS